uniref:Transcriptional regulator n=1 Tax=Haemonchus contortus TaxID=6289 RepID=A0A7I4Y7V5_HAECO
MREITRLRRFYHSIKLSRTWQMIAEFSRDQDEHEIAAPRRAAGRVIVERAAGDGVA